MLKKKIQGKIYLNVRNGGLEKYDKATGTKELFNEVGGLVTDLRVKDAVDFNKLPIQDVHLELYDDKDCEYYVIVARKGRPFANGLILSLGNVPDLTQKVSINSYTLPNKTDNPTAKAPVFCSVRNYQNPNEKYKWVDNVPPTKEVTVGKQVVKDSEERDAFIDEVMGKVQVAIKDNASLIPPQTLAPVSPESDQTDDESYED